jgi:GTP-binding protein
MMNIVQAVFKGSFPQARLMPEGSWPEFAFIGRSNVGKSSLINLLTDRDELAHTSAKPGKTQSINVYLINGAWTLVDLPGYGYARVSKTMRKRFGQLIEDYIRNSRRLACLFVLVDANIAPQKLDIDFINWLGENGVPFCLVFTKTDRQKPPQIAENIERIKASLLEFWEELPPMFVTSAAQRTGREELLTYIAQTANEIAEAS